MNKSGPRVCVEILLHLVSPAVYCLKLCSTYSLELAAYAISAEICFA